MAKENVTPEDIAAALAGVFNPKKPKKTEKLNRILVINGTISGEFISKKQVRKVVKQLATTDAVVQTYVLEGTWSTDLEVSLDAGNADAKEPTND